MSVPPINANAFSFWHGDPASSSNGPSGDRPPSEDSSASRWATPRAGDGQKGGPNQRDGSGSLHLTSQASRWPPPAARDGKGENSSEHLSKERGHHDQLPNFVKMHWPTPVASDAMSAGRATTQAEAMHTGQSLTDAMRSWPTPQAHDAKAPKTPEQIEAMRQRTGAGVANLNEVATNWPTPAARDGDSRGATRAESQAFQNKQAKGAVGASGLPSDDLKSAAVMWQTPSAGSATGGHAHRGGTRSDELLLAGQARAMYPTPAATPYGSSQNGINGKGGEFERPSAGTPSLETMAKQGLITGLPDPETAPDGKRSSPSILTLNPQFVEMLMGWPPGWTALDSAETESSVSKPPTPSPSLPKEPSVEDSAAEALEAPQTKPTGITRVLSGEARFHIETGDCMAVLDAIPDGVVQTVVTSPAYWGLRDYGTAQWSGGNDPACDHKVRSPESIARQLPTSTLGGGKESIAHQQEGYATECRRCGAQRIDLQLGQEATPGEYVDKLVVIFRKVRRVLRDDGTVWLNLGDSYAGSRAGAQGPTGQMANRSVVDARCRVRNHTNIAPGLKPKDLVMIPARVAMALQADGWYLRGDIIWAKPNPMPESVTDRPTKSHEHLFLLSKSERYFYDIEATRELWVDERMGRDGAQAASERNRGGRTDGFTKPNGIDPSANSGRNKRDVWTDCSPEVAMDSLLGALEVVGVPKEQCFAALELLERAKAHPSVWRISTRAFAGAHFAVFPPDLVEPCIRAGASAHGACATCGAPYERQVERWRLVDGEPAQLPPMKTTNIDEPSQAQGVGHGRISSATATLGWAATCECNAPVRSCIVLDPFAGAGTTGLVATRFGHRFIGIELSAKYAQMARDRIDGDAPLWNRMPERPL